MIVVVCGWIVCFGVWNGGLAPNGEAAGEPWHGWFGKWVIAPSRSELEERRVVLARAGGKALSEVVCSRWFLEGDMAGKNTRS